MRHFRVSEFEAAANANEGKGEGHWSDSFPVPSLNETRSLYLCSQWLFTFCGFVQQQRAEGHVSAAVSLDVEDCLRMQRMGLDCLVYAERVRVLFYSSQQYPQEGCGARCEVCSHIFSAADLLGNEDSRCGLAVPCPSCSVFTELCARTLLPITALPPPLTSSPPPATQLYRRCSLCTAPTSHALVSGTTEFDWLSEDSYAAMSCLYCSVNMTHAN
jgi:hypothetical protein